MKHQAIVCTLAALWMIPTAAVSQERRAITVDELFALVEEGSGSLRYSKAAADVAEQALEEAESRRLPDINASLSVSYNGNVVMTDRDFGNATVLSTPHWGNSLTVEARQTLYAGGSITAGVRLAEVQLRQAEAGVELTRASQRMDALSLYVGLCKADNGIRVYENNIKLAEKLIDNISAKREQGMALANDVTRHELRLASLRLDLRKERDRRAVLNRRLCTVLGIDSVCIVPDTAVASVAVSDAGEAHWQQLASVSSPTLRLAALGVDAAGQQLRQARSAMRPEVDIVAADNFSGPFYYDLPPVDNNFNTWYVGVGVRYSISSLFKAKKGVRKARAAVMESRENHAVTADALADDVQEAYTLYRQSFVELATREKSVELAVQNYEVTNDRYLADMALVTDMVDAANVRLDAELRAADARMDIVLAYYRMLYLAGEI